MESMDSLGDDRIRFSEAFDDAPIGMALVEIDSRTDNIPPQGPAFQESRTR
jgi:hypothetical protein